MWSVAIFDAWTITNWTKKLHLDTAPEATEGKAQGLQAHQYDW